MSRRSRFSQPWHRFSLRTLGVLTVSAAFIALSYAIPRRSVPFGAYAHPPVFLSGDSLKTVQATAIPPTYSPPSTRLHVWPYTHRKTAGIGCRRNSLTNRPLSPTCNKARGRRDCAGMMGDLQLLWHSLILTHFCSGKAIHHQTAQSLT